MANINVNISVKDAVETVKNYIENNGISTECVGSYSNYTSSGQEVAMLVFEKYFMRTSNRASLSVIIENLNGRTSVCSIGSGGGQNALFSFDWGAADSFAGLVEKALKKYII